MLIALTPCGTDYTAFLVETTAILGLLAVNTVVRGAKSIPWDACTEIMLAGKCVYVRETIEMIQQLWQEEDATHG